MLYLPDVPPGVPADFLGFSIPSFFHVQRNIIRSPSQLIPSLSWRAFFSIVPFSINCINRQDLAASIGCLPWIASYIA